MAQRILSVALTYIPGVAINQHRTGGIVFRFTAAKGQDLVNAMEATIDAIIRAVGGAADTPDQEDTEPAIPIPPHVPVPAGPAQRPRPAPLPPQKPQPPQGGVKIPKGPLSIEEARAVALQLAGKAQTPHNPHKQPTTIRRGSDEARAMAHAQNGGEPTAIVQRRRESSGPTLMVAGGEGPNRRRTRQPVIVTVQDGKMVTGVPRRAKETEEAAVEVPPAEPVEVIQTEADIMDAPAPVIREGFTPDDDDDYGPPPERIERVGEA